MPGGIASGFNISSSMQYDRGVLLVDDCEGAEHWLEDGTGEDWDVSFVSDAAWFGTNGMKVVTKTTTPADGDICTVSRWFSFPCSKLLVMRLRYAVKNIIHMKSITFKIILYNEVREYQAALKISPQVPKMERLNSLGDWTAIGGFGQSRSPLQWDMLEMQIDIGLLTYKSCLSLGVEKDLNNSSIQNVGVNTDRAGKLELTVESDGSDSATAYFDSIYIGEFVNL